MRECVLLKQNRLQFVDTCVSHGFIITEKLRIHKKENIMMSLQQN